MMKILIAGPGAIGCLFAALLKEAGNSVQMLSRDLDNTALIREQGIIIEEGDNSRSVSVDISSNTSDLDIPELLCVCVKSFDTVHAMKPLQNLISEETTVATIQNGLGNAEIISQSVDPARVICVATAQGSNRKSPGHIVHAGNGHTTVSPFLEENLAAAETTAEVFSHAGIESTAASDCMSVLWGKAIVNAAINPVTAIWNVPNGAILEDEELTEIMTQAAGEAAATARAKGIRLPYQDPAEQAAEVCRKTSENISSMLQDVRMGRKTEIDSINGVIIKEARSLGIETPVNKMLVERISKL